MLSNEVIPLLQNFVSNNRNKELNLSLPDGKIINNLNEEEVKEHIKEYVTNNTINNYNYTINVNKNNNFIFLIPIVTSA